MAEVASFSCRGAECASAGAIAGADVARAVMSVGEGHVGAWAAAVIRAAEYCVD